MCFDIIIIAAAVVAAHVHLAFRRLRELLNFILILVFSKDLNYLLLMFC